jgi:hypothetical protein
MRLVCQQGAAATRRRHAVRTHCARTHFARVWCALLLSDKNASREAGAMHKCASRGSTSSRGVDVEGLQGAGEQSSSCRLHMLPPAAPLLDVQLWLAPGWENIRIRHVSLCGCHCCCAVSTQVAGALMWRGRSAKRLLQGAHAVPTAQHAAVACARLAKPIRIRQ